MTLSQEEYMVRRSIRNPLKIPLYTESKILFLDCCIHDIDRVDLQLIDQQNHLRLWGYEKDFPQPHPLEAKGFENTNPRESSPS